MLGLLSLVCFIFLMKSNVYKIMIYYLNKILVIAVTTLSGLMLGLMVGLLPCGHTLNGFRYFLPSVLYAGHVDKKYQQSITNEFCLIGH